MERTIITYKLNWINTVRITNAKQFYNVIASYNDKITISSKYQSLILNIKRI